MPQLLFQFLIFIFLPLQAQYSVVIKTEKLRNNNGTIFWELTDEHQARIAGGIQNIENNTCIISIKNIQKGKYIFKYFHDENCNNKLDKNCLGIPTEGFGFSNNAKGSFGPPETGKTIFRIENDTLLICHPTYYL